MSDTKSGLSTQSVHAGEPKRKAGGAITTPIACTATYVFNNTQEICNYFDGEVERHEYGRYGNPTMHVAEKKLAALEGAEDAAVFSTGMAAITNTLLAMLRTGQHIVMTNDCYRRTRQFVGNVLNRFGVECTLVEPGDFDALDAAIIDGKTKMILSESPTNPYLRVMDMEKLVAVAKNHRGVKTVVDATFATPINQRPLDYGVDLVFHSCTKYLAGHNDMLGGVVCGKAPIIGALRDFRGIMGGILDAHSAYLLIRGIKTLDLRVQRQNQSAMAVAQWLETQDQVERVYYPGLESHPDHDVAVAQMSGYGGVVSFLAGSDLKEAAAIIDRCKLATIAPSLGGVETLIEQPALMSFYELTQEQRLDIGIRDNLIRLAIGIEDAADIIADLDQALNPSGEEPC
jgi:cystathionine gamma-synthase